MIAPLVCALVYLALSVRILSDVSLALSGAEKEIHASVRTGGFAVCVNRPLNLRNGKPVKEKMNKLKKRRKLFWLLRAVLKTIRWGVISVRIRLGTGDAAATAVAAGMIQSLIKAAFSAAGASGFSEVSVFPDFAKPCAVLNARCIFSFSFGDVMGAAVRAAVKKTRKEGFKWLSTLSRA